MPRSTSKFTDSLVRANCMSRLSTRVWPFTSTMRSPVWMPRSAAIDPSFTAVTMACGPFTTDMTDCSPISNYKTTRRG